MNGISVSSGISPPTIPSAATSKPIDMKDEYGDMDCSGETFIAKNFMLESGYTLPEAHVRRNHSPDVTAEAYFRN